MNSLDFRKNVKSGHRVLVSLYVKICFSKCISNKRSEEVIKIALRREWIALN